MNREIAAELHRIASLHDGELKPSDVVSEAERADSPLHSHFEWSDTIAAHAFRLAQARRLIRVTVEYIAAPAPVPTRVFVSLSDDRTRVGGGYRVTAAVMQNPAQKAQLLEDALVEMRRFEAKYRSLTELAAVFEAMHGVAA